MLRSLPLIGTLVVLLLAGCGTSSQPPDQETGSSAVDTAAVRSALDSLNTVVEQAATDGNVETLTGLLAPDARVSLPGHPSAQGRDSISALLRTEHRPLSELNLQRMDLRLPWAGIAYEYGTATATFGMSESRATYFVLLKRADAGWTMHRASISHDETVSTVDNVVALFRNSGVTPIAVYRNGALRAPTAPATALLNRYPRYLVYRASSPPDTFRVQETETVRFNVRHDSALVGHGRLFSSSPPDTTRWVIAVSAQPGSGTTGARVPPLDTALTAAHRALIRQRASDVLRSIEGPAGDNTTSTVRLTHASYGDLNGDKRTEYVVEALGRRRAGPASCQIEMQRAFVMVGRIVDGRWEELHSTRSGESRLLRVLDIGRDGKVDIVIKNVSFARANSDCSSGRVHQKRAVRILVPGPDTLETATVWTPGGRER